MTVGATTWVLCGIAKHKEAPRDALQLSLGAKGNLTVDISGIDRKLRGRVPPAFRDLIRIATYVFAADAAVGRGDPDDVDFGEAWHRRFHFVVGVKCLSVWQSPEIRQILEETLGFLSDDTYTFEFVEANIQDPEQMTFSGFASWDHIDGVQLFSGGQDSFAGAVEEVLKQKRKIVLVSHKSASKMWPIQRALSSKLGDLAVAAGVARPAYVPVCITKHGKELRAERSQRSRSFLYVAIAAAVADLIGRDRIRLYENGIVGLNLPISPQLVGAKATRTAHPRVLSGFSRILSHVAGKPFKAENPFALKTRTEILTELGSTAAASLIGETVSCAYVSSRRTEQPHCGICSQCVDRRIAVLGAGVERHDPEDKYERKLATDSWGDKRARGMLLAYVEAASKFAACRNTDEFLKAFGEAAQPLLSLSQALDRSVETVNREVFQLHVRHGQAVTRVVNSILTANAERIVKGDLSPDSVPMLLDGWEQSRQGAALATPASVTQSEYIFRQSGTAWTIRYRGGPLFTLKTSAGLGYIAYLLGRPGEVIMPAKLYASCAGEAVPGTSDIEGMDEQTFESVRARFEQLKASKAEAEEFCDQAAVAQFDSDIALLAPIVEQAAKAHRRSAPSREQVDVRDLVEREIMCAISIIREKSQPLAEHLDKRIQTGCLLWYRRTGIAWDIVPSVREDASLGEVSKPDNALLYVDLHAGAVRYRGHDIPTTGPKNLDHQPLFALAVLARNPGKALAMVDLGAEMSKLGWRDKNKNPQDARQLGFKLREPFRHALRNEPCKAEIDGLFETIPKLGLRLNLKPEQVAVVLRPSSPRRQKRNTGKNPAGNALSKRR